MDPEFQINNKMIGRNTLRYAEDAGVTFHPIAGFILMRFGVPQRVCKVLFSRLQKAKHHIKTGFGRTEAVYGDKTAAISLISNGMGPAGNTEKLKNY